MIRPRWGRFRIRPRPESRPRVRKFPQGHLRQPQRPTPEAVPQVGRVHQRPRARHREAIRRGSRGEDPRAAREGRRRRGPRGSAARGVRGRTRGREARAGHAPLRRSARGRRGAASGQDRGDAHRRGQDARGDAAVLSQRPHGQGRAHRHGERLPRPPRRGVDGAHPPLPRPFRGRGRAADGPRRQAGRLPGGHHLRNQQRVRLRLPARQHGHAGGRAVPARTALRDRRRGGLDPHRRGEDAAHHLRPGRGFRRPLPQDQRPGSFPREAGGREGRGRLLAGPQAAERDALRAGPRARRGTDGEGGAAHGGGEPLRPGQHHADASPLRGHPGPRALPPRPALRDPGRRGGDRRRVHRPDDAGPALVRRASPGGGGEGGRHDQERVADARLDHLPELLPALQEARRHDRHGRHGGLRVLAHLQPGDGADSHAPPDDPQGLERPGLHHREGEVPGHPPRGDRTATGAASPCSWARPRSRIPS